MLPRRALVDALLVASVARDARPASAGDRVRAQTVGIDTGSPLVDPRNFGAEKGIVWGGRDRCDPTDVTCQQGGIEQASDVQAVPIAPGGLEVSDRVRFSVSIAGEGAGELEVGLFRSAAPDSVETFMRLSRGTLITASDDKPASFERSVALRVQRDKQVVLGGLKQQGGSMRLLSGQTRPQRVPVAPPTNGDDNALTHSAAGLVSVRKGGGSFEFTITTRPFPARDRDGLVIGQVVSGMELLERLNTLPTNNYNGGPMAVVRLEHATVL